MGAPSRSPNRGFHLLATSRLADALRRYQHLRANARDEAVRAYAQGCIAEIHEEFARRTKKRQVAA